MDCDEIISNWPSTKEMSKMSCRHIYAEKQMTYILRKGKREDVWQNWFITKHKAAYLLERSTKISGKRVQWKPCQLTNWNKIGWCHWRKPQ